MQMISLSILSKYDLYLMIQFPSLEIIKNLYLPTQD